MKRIITATLAVTTMAMAGTGLGTPVTQMNSTQTCSVPVSDLAWELANMADATKYGSVGQKAIIAMVGESCPNPSEDLIHEVQSDAMELLIDRRNEDDAWIRAQKPTKACGSNKSRLLKKAVSKYVKAKMSREHTSYAFTQYHIDSVCNDFTDKQTTNIRKYGLEVLKGGDINVIVPKRKIRVVKSKSVQVYNAGGNKNLNTRGDCYVNKAWHERDMFLFFKRAWKSNHQAGMPKSKCANWTDKKVNGILSDAYAVVNAEHVSNMKKKKAKAKARRVADSKRGVGFGRAKFCFHTIGYSDVAKAEDVVWKELLRAYKLHGDIENAQVGGAIKSVCSNFTPKTAVNIAYEMRSAFKSTHR